MSNPGEEHWDALMHILNYLAAYPNAHIEYRCPPEAWLRGRFVAYVDSDHAGDLDNRRSTFGFVIFFNGGPVAWSTGKQKSASSSSAESEYKALHKLVLEIMFLRQFAEELGYVQDSPTIIFEDNDACAAFASDPLIHGRMKHIDIAYHVIKDYAEQGHIKTVRVDSAHNLADSMTKATSPAAFRSFLQGVIKIGRP